MQAGEMRRRSGGKFLERVRKLGTSRSRRFRSHAKGVLIVLVHAPIQRRHFPRDADKFKGAPASRVNTPDLSAFSTSGNDPSSTGTLSGEPSNGGPAAGRVGSQVWVNLCSIKAARILATQVPVDKRRTGAFTDPSSQGPKPRLPRLALPGNKAQPVTLCPG